MQSIRNMEITHECNIIDDRQVFEVTFQSDFFVFSHDKSFYVEKGELSAYGIDTARPPLPEMVYRNFHWYRTTEAPDEIPIVLPLDIENMILDFHTSRPILDRFTEEIKRVIRTETVEEEDEKTGEKYTQLEFHHYIYDGLVIFPTVSDGELQGRALNITRESLEGSTVIPISLPVNTARALPRMVYHKGHFYRVTDPLPIEFPVEIENLIHEFAECDCRKRKSSVIRGCVICNKICCLNCMDFFSDPEYGEFSMHTFCKRVPGAITKFCEEIAAKRDNSDYYSETDSDDDSSW